MPATNPTSLPSLPLLLLHTDALEEVSSIRSPWPPDTQSSGQFSHLTLSHIWHYWLLSLSSHLFRKLLWHYCMHFNLLWPPRQTHPSVPTMPKTQSQVSSLLSLRPRLFPWTFTGSTIKGQAHDLPYKCVLLPLFPISVTITAVPSITKSKAHLSLTTYVWFIAS